MQNNRPGAINVPNTGQDPQGQPLSTDLEGSSGDYGIPVDPNYAIDPIRVRVQGEELVEPAVQTMPQDRLFGFGSISHRKSVIVSALITLLVIIITASSMLFFARNAADKSELPKAQIKTQDVSIEGAGLEELPQEFAGAKKSLVVNGDIITKGDLKISNGSFITVIKLQNPDANQTFTLPSSSGTICLDTNNCNYITAGQLQQVQNQLGQIVTPGIPASSLVNNQAGAVTIQGAANRITVATANGTIQLSTPQDIAQVSSPTFASLLLSANLSVNGNIITSLDCTGLNNGGVLTTNGSGQVICDDDDGGAGSPVNGSGTINRLTVLTAAQTIADSWLLQNGSTLQLDNTRNFTLLGGDLTLDSASSELRILESVGGSFYGTFDVGDLSVDQTYTLPDVSGTICLTSGNCVGVGGTGDVLNNGQNGPLTVGTNNGTSFTLETNNTPRLVINTGGTVTITGLNSAGVVHTNGSGDLSTGDVVLGSETSGSFVANLGVLTGLSATGNSGEASTPTLSVLYGATANTAVQGNTAINCATVSGNLTGGGGSITLGSGGSCNAIGLTATPTFTTVDATTFTGALVGNASTASALAANPTDCSANQFATTIAANGNLTCAALTDGDIPNSITIDLATTATALAANPSDCAANQFANAIAANGNLSCAGIVDADVSDTLTASIFIGSGSTTNAIDLATAEIAGVLADANVSDTLTIGASSTVADGALSANVSLLGQTIEGTEITNGTVANVDLANSSLTVTAGNGLSGGGSVSLGGSTSLAVLYGSGANNAAAGANTFTCTSGTGNLTGGGTVVTLGVSGTTCAAIDVVASPTFSGLTLNGNLNLNANTLQGTTAVIDFTNFDVASTGNITTAGDLVLNGGDLSSSGALTVTPNSGNNFNVVLSGAGDFVVNTNQLYVDTSSGFVGIGDSTPDFKLDVESTSTAISGSNTNTRSELTVSPASAPASATAYTGLLGASTTASSNLNSNITMYGMAGVVTNSGSGTLSLALSVAGGVFNTGAGSITDAIAVMAFTPTVSLGSIANGIGVYIQTQDVAGVGNGYGIYQQGNTDVNYLGGFLGVRDTTPDALLEILGTSEQLRISNADGTQDVRFTVDSSANLTLNAVGSAGYVRIGDTGTPGAANGDDDLYVEGDFEVDATTTLGGNLTVTGNVLPGANDTYDLGSTALRWRDLYLGADTIHLGTSATDEATFSYNTAANILNIGTDGTTNGDIAFFTDDLYLDKSSGFVGIGNTLPSVALHVTGSARISGLVSCDTVDTDANGNLSCGTDSGAGSTTLQAAYDADTNGGDAIINLTSSDGGILIRDSVAGLGTTLFAVQNDDGSVNNLAVDNSGISTDGSIIAQKDVQAYGVLAAGNSSNTLTPGQLLGVGTFSTTVDIAQTVTDLTSTDIVTGISNQLLLDPVAPATAQVTGSFTGIATEASNLNDYSNITGTSSGLEHRGSGTVSSMVGLMDGVINSGSGTIEQVYGSYTAVQNAATGTFGDAAALAGILTNEGVAETLTGSITGTSNTGTAEALYGSRLLVANTADITENIVGDSLVGSDVIVTNSGNVDVGGSANVIGSRINVMNSGVVGGPGDLLGSQILVTNTSTTALSELIGQYILQSNGNGDVSRIYGLVVAADSTGTGIIGESAGILVGAQTDATDLNVGIRINQSSGATANINLAIDDTPASGDYSIYNASTYANLFAGQLQFSGVATDLTTATNEDLTVVASGSGIINLNDTTSVGGNLTVAGNILPGTTNTYTLGSDSARWQDIFLGASSLHIGTNTSDEGVLSYNTTTDSLIAKNATNSTAAFQIQNTSGSSLFTADTSNMIIRPGTVASYSTQSRVTTQIVSANNEGTPFNSIAIGVDGLPIIAYNDETTNDLVIAHCTAADCSAQTITNVTTAPNDGEYPAITIGKDGLPIILHYNVTATDPSVTHCDNIACTSSTTTVIADVDGAGTNGSIAIGTDGLPILAYRNFTDGDLTITKCANIACTSVTATTQLSNADNVGYTASIKIGSDGLPVIAYDNDTDDDAMVTKCTNQSCTSQTTTQLTTSDDDGAWTSLAIGTNGMPTIVYTDITASDSITIVACTNLDCSGRQVGSVDDSDGYGGSLSLAINSKGLPVIAAYNATDVDLNVISCADTLCAVPTTTSFADADGTGLYNDIAIGVDGVPIIVHQNSTDTDIMITKCVDSTCSASSGSVMGGGATLGSVAGAWRSLYFDTLNLGREGAHVELNEIGNFRANDLFADADGNVSVGAATEPYTNIKLRVSDAVTGVDSDYFAQRTELIVNATNTPTTSTTYLGTQVITSVNGTTDGNVTVAGVDSLVNVGSDVGIVSGFGTALSLEDATTAYGYFGSIATAGTITNAYGLYLAQSTGTITNSYGVYQAGTTDENYFAGTANFAGDLIQSGNAVNGLGDSESMLPNAGFEINNDATTTSADNWIFAQTVATATPSVTSTSPGQGDRSQQIVTSAAAAEGTLTSACVPISASQTYSLSVRIKGSVAATSAFDSFLDTYTSKANCVANTSVTVVNGTANGTLPTTWGTLTANTAAGTTATWARVRLRFGSASAAATMTVDGVRLTPSALTTGVDLAENFPVEANTGLLPGELVSFGLETADGAYAIRTTGAYDSKLFGVVSTQPGLTLDDSKEYEKVTVALAGRVPVKVSDENGTIAVGDPITASSVPGVGMKASTAGQIIGYAMQDHVAGGASSIVVKLAPGFWAPTAANVIQAQTANFGGLQITGTASIATLNVSGATTLANLTVTGDTLIEGKLTVTGSINAADLYVNGKLVSKGPVPQIANGAALNGILNVTAGVTGTDSAGTVTVTVGANVPATGELIEVTFDSAYATPPRIVISGNNAKSAKLGAYVVRTATGFKLVSDQPLETNTTYQFDYVVIGAENE